MSTLNINIENNLKASQDSEEGAQITTDLVEPLAGGDEGGAGKDMDQIQPSHSSSGAGGRVQAGAISGHHDPKQRRIYLAILAFSIANALLGLTLILVWMLNYRAVTGFGLSDKGQLSNLHPLLMYIFMVSLNMYSILIYRTHYDQPKQRLKWAHAILSGANMVMSLLGVAAMYKAHLLSNLANFYSLHSWIGALTNGLYLSQFIFGLIAFLRPGTMSAQRRAQMMPWHRLLGAMILVLAATAAITGIAELVIFQDQNGAYQKFTPITFIANFAGIAVVMMTAASIYLVTAPQYLRPPLPEERSLKRGG